MLGIYGSNIDLANGGEMKLSIIITISIAVHVKDKSNFDVEFIEQKIEGVMWRYEIQFRLMVFEIVKLLRFDNFSFHKVILP